MTRRTETGWGLSHEVTAKYQERSEPSLNKETQAIVLTKCLVQLAEKHFQGNEVEGS